MRRVSWLIFVFSILWGYVWAEPPERVQVVRAPNGGVVPDAEVDSEGRIHLAYVTGHDLYYVKSVDGGKTFSKPIRVNSEAGTVQSGKYRGPDLELGKDGQVHVIWYTTAYHRHLPKDQWGVHYSQLDSSTNTFVPSRNLNHQPSDNYSLAADREGTVAVFWTAHGLYLNLSRDDGKAFSKPQVVHQRVDPCECCATRAHFSPNGNLFSLYREKANNLRDMYLLALLKDEAAFSLGKLSGKPWKINGCPMTGTFLSGGKDEGLVAAWETKGQVYFARLDQRGQILPPGEIRTPGEGIKKYPVVLSAPEGTVLVAWKKESKLEWQLYDPAGNSQGDPGWAAGGNPHRPTGVVTKEGKFVLFP